MTQTPQTVELLRHSAIPVTLEEMHIVFLAFLLRLQLASHVSYNYCHKGTKQEQGLHESQAVTWKLDFMPAFLPMVSLFFPRHPMNARYIHTQKHQVL